jgi:hypothetical protein
MRRSLPVLNSTPDALDLVEIPIPCEVPWDAMPGDDQVRHCGQCKQSVYNVSAFTRAEALRLLGARACLRIYRRPDNTVLTSDCRERLRAARKKGLLVFAGVAVVILWAQICAQFVGLMGLRRLWGGRHTMGEPAPIELPIAVPGQIAPAPDPPPPMMGVPPPRPVMGEAPPVPSRKHRTMGKPAPDRADLMGRVAHRGPAID